MLLAHEVVTAPGATPTRLVVFLHGILGSGANLRAHARRFVQARPDWQAVLMDLRGHGKSLSHEGADTVEQAAADVLQTSATLPLPLTAAVGHSFGGKVALQLALDAPALAHVMTLDSAPGARGDAHGSEGTLAVLELLEQVHTRRWATRDAFLADIEAGGQSRGLGQWLAMNLEQQAGGFTFRLELPRIRALLRSYFELDLWSVVEHASAQMHLVIATRSRVYDEADRARADALATEASGRVTVDYLEAGHWVHVDDPEGVARVLLHRLG